MKQTLLIFALLTMGLLLPSLAELRASPPGGDTVAAAKAADDFSYVTLTGRIISHNTNNEQGRTDLYTFTDDQTGNIVIQVDESLVHGKGVTESTRVRISGEVDKSELQPRVRVRHLEVVAQ